MEEIRKAGKYTPQLITLEVGSRGPFYLAGFEKLRRFLKAQVKSWEPMLCKATRTALTESIKSGP